ncbi:hypothetical protein ACWGHM_40065 [Streptomyces sp. NPDC054904]
MRFPRLRARRRPGGDRVRGGAEQTFEFGLRILLGGPAAELAGRD